MSCDIYVLPEFSKEVKSLSKKFSKIKQDLKELYTVLKVNPKEGIAIWNNTYKLRLPSSSIPTGKSGGFRVIYYYLDDNNNIYLMNIYSKTQIENISEQKIIKILKNNGFI